MCPFKDIVNILFIYFRIRKVGFDTLFTVNFEIHFNNDNHFKLYVYNQYKLYVKFI
jgi:hypothetical protein